MILKFYESHFASLPQWIEFRKPTIFFLKKLMQELFSHPQSETKGRKQEYQLLECVGLIGSSASYPNQVVEFNACSVF